MIFQKSEEEQERINALIHQLESFHPAREEKNNLTNEQIIHRFRKIAESFSNSDIRLLGKKYDEWKTNCLFHFLTSPRYRTNIILEAPRIIQKYHEYKCNPDSSINQNLDILIN